ncbi:MAG TPA: hypothetical protein VI387_06815 [Candidatus Brocadiales bacterium]|nr:hypothetical protein [Candidatus Brocadiales bacterium]
MKSFSYLFKMVFLLVAVCIVSFGQAKHAEAGEAAINCCEISTINLKSGLVTSTETTSGKVFHFKVSDQKLLKNLKIGDKVSADFNGGKVAVLGLSPCCNIVQPDVKTQMGARK